MGEEKRRGEGRGGESEVEGIKCNSGSEANRHHTCAHAPTHTHTHLRMHAHMHPHTLHIKRMEQQKMVTRGVTNK